MPHEIDSVRRRRWDAVLVNQYIYELKEARKQGRKEKRHKEAQAVLAAATAAAAASSRVSSLRKDAVDESSQQEVINYKPCCLLRWQLLGQQYKNSLFACVLLTHYLWFLSGQGG